MGFVEDEYKREIKETLQSIDTTLKCIEKAITMSIFEVADSIAGPQIPSEEFAELLKQEISATMTNSKNEATCDKKKADA